MKASDDSGVLIRVIGSLAFQMYYPECGYLQADVGHAYTDIDFAAYDKQSKQIQDLMTALAYTENREVFIASEAIAPSA